MNFKTILALGAGLLGTAQAFAAPVTVDFEDFSGFEYGTQIGNHYSGLGVTFGPDALSLSNGDGIGGYYAPEGHTAGAVMFPTAGSASLNFAQGFDAASFAYVANDATTVNVYDGLNGTGSIVYSFVLAATSSWTTVANGGSFLGNGYSIAFGEGVGAAFDDVSVAPVPLPAAAWLLLSGLGGLGAMARRKRLAASA